VGVAAMTAVLREEGRLQEGRTPADSF
jgi:hypothetical protein